MRTVRPQCVQYSTYTLHKPNKAHIRCTMYNKFSALNRPTAAMESVFQLYSPSKPD